SVTEIPRRRCDVTARRVVGTVLEEDRIIGRGVVGVVVEGGYRIRRDAEVERSRPDPTTPHTDLDVVGRVRLDADDEGLVVIGCAAHGAEAGERCPGVHGDKGTVLGDARGNRFGRAGSEGVPYRVLRLAGAWRHRLRGFRRGRGEVDGL